MQRACLNCGLPVNRGDQGARWYVHHAFCDGACEHEYREYEEGVTHAPTHHNGADVVRLSDYRKR